MCHRQRQTDNNAAKAYFSLGVGLVFVARNTKLLALILTLVMGISGVTGVAGAMDGNGEQAAIGSQIQVEEPTTNETTDTESDLVAPGVYQNGTANLTTLYAAHRQVLAAQGFEATTNASVELNGSMFFTLQAETRGSSSLAEYQSAANITIAGYNVSVSKWMNESLVFTRVVVDDNASYEVSPRTPPGLASDSEMENETNGPMMTSGSQEMGNMGMGMHHGQMAQDAKVPGQSLLLLDQITGNLTVENASEANETVNVSLANDTQLYRLTGPLELQQARGNPTGTVTILVDERGVVHQATATIDYQLYDGQFDYQLELEQLGVDDVQRPGWIAEVPEEAIPGGAAAPGDGPRGPP